MACTRTLQPSLDDHFSSSAASTSSATPSTRSYHPPSPLPHSAPQPPANPSPPLHSLSPLSSSPASSVPALSPAALHSLIATKQRELSDITSLQTAALSSQLAGLTAAYDALKAGYAALKADFLYNLNLLNERDAELTQWEADDQTRQRRDDDRERECVALRSELRVRAVKEKERGDEERQRRVELTAGYETKLAVLSEEASRLRVTVEEERTKGDRRVEAVREEAERERREVQRAYEARLGEEQRARIDDKEALDEALDHKDRDQRRAEESMQAMAVERDAEHQQLVALQADKKEADRLCRHLQHQLVQSHEQLASLQKQLHEATDSSDTRHGQLLRERDEALHEWKAAVLRAEEERVEREKERAEEAERRRVALAAERQREEERAAEWRRRMDEKVEEAEAERRERRKVEYESVMARQQAEAEREALETRLEELQHDDERKEQEWKREVWRLTEEVKDRRERMERMQREKEQRREELIRVKATVDEYREREEEWTRGKEDRQRQTNEVEEERRRSQELEEELVRLRIELQRRRELENARPAFAVHVTDEHGQQQYKPHKPHRPTSIHTTTLPHPHHSQPLRNDYSPAFSDDLGPVSLPASQTSSPRPAVPSSPSALQRMEQLQTENESLRAAIDTMRGEMHRVVSEVEARHTRDEGGEVERLRRECEMAKLEREEWRLERERLLDISNRLKAELRRKRPVAVHDEKEQQVEERRVGSTVAAWKVGEEVKQHGTVGDIDRVRQALNGLIHSNQQLSDNIKALSAAPHLQHASSRPPPPLPLPPPSLPPPSLPASHPSSAASVSATPPESSISSLSDVSTGAAAAVSPTSSRLVSAGRTAHRRSSALRRLQTAELALSSAAALNAEVERLSPRSDDVSPRPISPSPTATAAVGSPPRDRLQLNGKRAALMNRESERRDAAGRAAATRGASGQASGGGKREQTIVSPVRSRMNLAGKVRNYAAGP